MLIRARGMAPYAENQYALVAFFGGVCEGLEGERAYVSGPFGSLPLCFLSSPGSLPSVFSPGRVVLRSGLCTGCNDAIDEYLRESSGTPLETNLRLTNVQV